jgi:hypothetical protein
VLTSFLESYVGTYLLRFLISRPRNAGISALPHARIMALNITLNIDNTTDRYLVTDEPSRTVLSVI